MKPFPRINTKRVSDAVTRTTVDGGVLEVTTTRTSVTDPGEIGKLLFAPEPESTIVQNLEIVIQQLRPTAEASPRGVDARRFTEQARNIMARASEAIRKIQAGDAQRAASAAFDVGRWLAEFEICRGIEPEMRKRRTSVEATRQPRSLRPGTVAWYLAELPDWEDWSENKVVAEVQRRQAQDNRPRGMTSSVRQTVRRAKKARKTGTPQRFKKAGR